MNFIDLLKADHQEAKESFKTLLKTEEIDRKISETLCQKLQLHMELEERYFYPVMENYKVTEELSQEAELEHTEAKKFIRSLLNNSLENTEYKVKLEMLQLAIEHHVQEEEKELFPLAEKKLNQPQIQDITEKMQQLKAQKTSEISGASRS